jgi:Response regulator containing CheY-like receiver, AAA-type ATPase, and DNA-binding domains
MSKKNKKIIFCVDDDELFRKAFEIEFMKDKAFDVVSFSSGEECLENLSMKPDIIVLDYFLDGLDKNAMNGLKTLDAIKTHDTSIPVIIMSSQDSIEVAVNCLHHEAFDYVVKSETAFIRLRKTISSILLYRKMEQELKKFGDKV